VIFLVHKQAHFLNKIASFICPHSFIYLIYLILNFNLVPCFFWILLSSFPLPHPRSFLSIFLLTLLYLKTVQTKNPSKHVKIRTIDEEYELCYVLHYLNFFSPLRYLSLLNASKHACYVFASLFTDGWYYYLSFSVWW
jgi:hypothetical protein